MAVLRIHKVLPTAVATWAGLFIRPTTYCYCGPQGPCGSASTQWLHHCAALPVASGLMALQSALQAAFPACTDLSDDPQRGITAFTPHLSLGQWHNKQQLLAALQVRACRGKDTLPGGIPPTPGAMFSAAS